MAHDASLVNPSGDWREFPLLQVMMSLLNFADWSLTSPWVSRAPRLFCGEEYRFMYGMCRPTVLQAGGACLENCKRCPR